MEKSLSKSDWLRAARLALLKDGASGVRVERLARNLHVTKGSFYWHFKDREELLELLLREWEEEFSLVAAHAKDQGGHEAIEPLIRYVVEQAPRGEDGLLPSDAAILAWASVSPEVASRVNRAEAKRLELLTRLVGNADLAEVLYLVWLGFVARGKRIPKTRKRFPQIARTILELLPREKTKNKKSQQKLNPKGC